MAHEVLLADRSQVTAAPQVCPSRYKPLQEITPTPPHPPVNSATTTHAAVPLNLLSEVLLADPPQVTAALLVHVDQLAHLACRDVIYSVPQKGQANQDQPGGRRAPMDEMEKRLRPQV